MQAPSSVSSWWSGAVAGPNHRRASLATARFLLLMVVWRRLRHGAARLDDQAFGAASRFGSALVDSVGPMVAPFFLSRGLVRGAYIGTEVAAAVAMQ